MNKNNINNKNQIQNQNQKFKMGIDKNNNFVVTIDQQIHFLTSLQFESMMKRGLFLLKKCNPEIDYSKIL